MTVKVRVEQSPLKVRVGQADAIKILSSAPIGSKTVENVVGGIADVTALNVSGISTFAGNINSNGNIVGDNETNISGISSVTATSFFGDGSGLTNTGAILSAASGSQRLILSSLTSGIMVSAATDADLSFNATSNLLSTGKLLVAGISTFNDNAIIDGSLTVGSNHSAITGGAPTDAGNLAVYGTGKNSLIIQTTSNGDDRGIAWRNSGDAYVAYIAAVNRGSSTADLVFGVDSFNTNIDSISERMRITKEGDVGIGIINPSAKLDVAGNLNITNDANVTGTLTAGLIDGGSF